MPKETLREPQSPWIEHTRFTSAATVRLYCLPYAGGSAAIYREWYGDPLAQLEVCPVQLPGRERRINEVPFDRIPSLVAALVDVLSFNRPFALFGHSLGALVAFELARELRRRGREGPIHIFVSGAPAPQLCPIRPARFRLSREELIAELRGLGGTREAVFANDDLLDLILPTIRADFSMCDTYLYDPEPPLTSPITAFAGDADVEVDRDHVLQWRSQTTGRFRLIQIAGDHFFLNSRSATVRTEVAAVLSSCHDGLKPRQTVQPNPLHHGGDAMRIDKLR